MENLAEMYSDAEKIIVVMDNLNTHDFSAFYEEFKESFSNSRTFYYSYRMTYTYNAEKNIC